MKRIATGVARILVLAVIAGMLAGCHISDVPEEMPNETSESPSSAEGTDTAGVVTAAPPTRFDPEVEDCVVLHFTQTEKNVHWQTANCEAWQIADLPLLRAGIPAILGNRGESRISITARDPAQLDVREYPYMMIRYRIDTPAVLHVVPDLYMRNGAGVLEMLHRQSGSGDAALIADGQWHTQGFFVMQQYELSGTQLESISLDFGTTSGTSLYIAYIGLFRDSAQAARFETAFQDQYGDVLSNPLLYEKQEVLPDGTVAAFSETVTDFAEARQWLKWDTSITDLWEIDTDSTEAYFIEGDGGVRLRLRDASIFWKERLAQDQGYTVSLHTQFLERPREGTFQDFMWLQYSAERGPMDASGKTGSGVALSVGEADTLQIAVVTYSPGDKYPDRIMATVNAGMDLTQPHILTVTDDGAGRIEVQADGRLLAAVQYRGAAMFGVSHTDLRERYYRHAWIYDGSGKQLAATDKAMLSATKAFGITGGCAMMLDAVAVRNVPQGGEAAGTPPVVSSTPVVPSVMATPGPSRTPEPTAPPDLAWVPYPYRSYADWLQWKNENPLSYAAWQQENIPAQEVLPDESVCTVLHNAEKSYWILTRYADRLAYLYDMMVEMRSLQAYYDVEAAGGYYAGPADDPLRQLPYRVGMLPLLGITQEEVLEYLKWCDVRAQYMETPPVRRHYTDAEIVTLFSGDDARILEQFHSALAYYRDGEVYSIYQLLQTPDSVLREIFTAESLAAYLDGADAHLESCRRAGGAEAEQIYREWKEIYRPQLTALVENARGA